MLMPELLPALFGTTGARGMTDKLLPGCWKCAVVPVVPRCAPRWRHQLRSLPGMPAPSPHCLFNAQTR